MAAVSDHQPLISHLAGVVLDTPDPRELCDFYSALLGWERVAYDEDWCKLMPPGGVTGLSFQLEPLHRPPVWPAGDDEQMQIHLDFKVADLQAAYDEAVRCGARPVEPQPRDDLRIMLDPHGHVFCLFLY